MPDAGFSRVCPSCGRHVPRSVSVCRCGSTLAAEPESSTPASAAPRALALVQIVALVATLAGAGYWLITRPRTASPSAGTTGHAVPAAPAADAPATAPLESAAARAWNAAAGARNIAATDTADLTQPPTPAAAPPGSIEEMVDRVMPAVVLIETSSGRGSGFFIANDTLITNVHVVQNDGYVTLRKIDGSSASARVSAKAPTFDLAVLKVAQPSTAQAVIPMGTAKGLKPGQEIIVIGSALGTLQNSVSRGIVSGLRNAGGATVVQTDAAVNPGNSGGPMLDRSGAVIGITTMKYSGAEGLNFGVAIDDARDLLDGRLAEGGTQSGLSAIQAQSQARQSESDRVQQQGEQQLRSRIGQLAAAARSVDADWQRYRKQCYQAAISGSYDHEWFAVVAPGGMPANAGAGCAPYYASLESQIRQFRDAMRATVSDARRANVLPGTIRDALRANQLEFEWER